MPTDKPTQGLGRGRASTAPLPWYQRPIDKNAAIGIGAFILYVATGLNMPWWATALVWFTLWILLAYLVLRSPWTIARRWVTKLSLCVVVAFIVASVGERGVHDEYREVYPIPTPNNVGTLVVPKNARLNRSIEFGDSGVILSLMNGRGESSIARHLDAVFRGMSLRIESEGSALKVSAQIRGESSRDLIAGIEDNEWKVKPFNWDRNYTEDALEVKDSRGRVVLQIRLLPDRVRIQAESWNDDGTGVRICEARDTISKHAVVGAIVFLRRGHDYNNLPIQPIFRYPSDLNFGQLLPERKQNPLPFPASDSRANQIIFIAPGIYTE
jgi:hypothetical protein